MVWVESKKAGSRRPGPRIGSDYQGLELLHPDFNVLEYRGTAHVLRMVGFHDTRRIDTAKLGIFGVGLKPAYVPEASTSP